MNIPNQAQGSACETKNQFWANLRKGVERVVATTRGYREVQIIGFIGIKGEEGILGAGHVGISLDRGRTIYGYQPLQEALNRAEALLKLLVADPNCSLVHYLRNARRLPGAIYVDTAVFRAAYDLSQDGSDPPKTAVWVHSQYISKEQYDIILAKVAGVSALIPRKGGYYTFPPYNKETRTGLPMKNNCNNCATWPATLGLWIPSNIGQLRTDYIPALIEAGAVQWAPPQKEV